MAFFDLPPLILLLVFTACGTYGGMLLGYRLRRGRELAAIRNDWQKGDILAIPPWSLHEHANIGSEDAILFSIQDQPVLEALGLYREEALAENLGRQLLAAAIPTT